MPRSNSKRIMFEDDCTVSDVYTVASEIGAECEKLIDIFGPDSVKSLLQKMIPALEMLEFLANKNENESSIVQELKERIKILEKEQMERAVSKKKFEKEIETIEEAWRCETRELCSVVSRLQSENHRLMIQEQKDVAPSDTYDESIQELREVIDKQRREIKDKHRELIAKSEQIDECQMEIEIYKHKIMEAKQRSKKYQSQVKNLFSERADFLAKLQDQSKSINSLKKELGISEKENESDGETGELCTPRFTVDDLKDLLNERNDLKNRVIELKEEIASLKLYKKINQTESVVEQRSGEDDDAPVQGPLPEEWYIMDDRWKKENSESGIRKFFKRIFTENEQSSFPKRSLSALTKMALSASGNPHSSGNFL